MAIDNITDDNGRSPRGVQITTDEPRFVLRFWSKVLLTSNPDKCWEWQASTYSNGYGRIWVDGAVRLAHRVVWKLTHGRYSDVLILHSCDNRKCVNPNHLREGTPSDNMWDKTERNRHNAVFGVASPVAKLNDEKIRHIREMLAQKVKYRIIAKQFEVGTGTISAIKSGQTWKHVV